MSSILNITKQLLLAKYALSSRHRVGRPPWFNFDKHHTNVQMYKSA